MISEERTTLKGLAKIALGFFALVIILFTVVALYDLSVEIASKRKVESIISSRTENTDIASKKKIENIISSRTENMDILPEGLMIDGQKPAKDDETGRYFYSCDTDRELGSVWRPEITFGDGGDESSFKTVLPETVMSKQFISSGEPVEVTFYTETEYCTIPVIITSLPLAQISTDGELGMDDTGMTFELWDNDPDNSNNYTLSSGLIHKRGATTLNFYKVGYKLSLTDDKGQKNDQNLLGLRKDDDWILYAAYNDAEKIRNVFSAKLWNDTCASDNNMDISLGMEYRYVELFINNEYRGLYALGYPIDNKQAETNENEHLYKCQRHVFSFSKRNIDSEGNGKTTGVIDGLKLCGGDDGENEEQSWEVLRRYTDILYDNEQYSDSELLDLVDIDNAIDIWLFTNLIQGIDHAAKDDGDLYNYFFAVKYDKKSDKYKVLSAPWDMDMTWGNCWNNDPDTEWETNLTSQYGVDVQTNTVFEANVVNILLQRNNSEMWNRVREKYAELRKNEWSKDKIGDIIDEYEADIFDSGAFERDREKWPDGSYCDSEDGLSVFKEYVLRRLEAMDGYMERLEAVRDRGEYIQRSVQFADFNDRQFIVQIYDPEVMGDEKLADFLSELGIEAEDVHGGGQMFLIGNDGEITDFDLSSSAGSVVETAWGELAFLRFDKWYENDECLSFALDSQEIDVYDPAQGEKMRILMKSEGGDWTLFKMSDFYGFHY